MIWFIEHQDEWQGMASASRTMVEDKFDVHKVNKALMRIMELDPVETAPINVMDKEAK